MSMQFSGNSATTYHIFSPNLISHDKKEKNYTENDIVEIFNQCYNIYKKEYMCDEDFSIKSDSISEELEEIINEYDAHLKKRNDTLSNSIYSDILDEFGIITFKIRGCYI